MKKFLALFCVLTVFLFLFSGCKKQNAPKKENQIPVTNKVELTTDQLFSKFLNGEVTAKDTEGNDKPLEEYYKNLSKKFTYCFIDINDDNKAELCIYNPADSFVFFTVKDGDLKHLCTQKYNAFNEKLTLLNNGAFLKEKNINVSYDKSYQYYELNQNGEEKFSITFYMQDEVNVVYATGEGISPAVYEINGVKVTEAEYKEVENKYLSIGSDKIVWYDKDGNIV